MTVSGTCRVLIQRIQELSSIKTGAEIGVDLGFTSQHLLHDRVRPGGLVAGHDYRQRSRRKQGVYNAVNEWVAQHGITLHLAGHTVWYYWR